jgi:hypothetical protein
MTICVGWYSKIIFMRRIFRLNTGQPWIVSGRRKRRTLRTLGAV